MDLKYKWTKLCLEFTQNKALIEEVWEEIESAYNSTNRAYHTLDHLQSMFHLEQEFLPHLNQPDYFSFSIFFHDYVYDPTRADNELKSAEYAREKLQALKVPVVGIELCYEQILATKNHEPADISDAGFLLDIDLSILGAPSALYQKYTTEIRKEYAVYPDTQYLPGRKEVLIHFLNKPRIYHTEEMFARWEEKARANLKMEINHLEQQINPLSK